MTQPHSQNTHAPRPSRIIAFAIGALAVLVLGFVLYGMKAPGGKEAAVDPACLATAQTAARLKPLVHGDVAALNLASTPHPLPELSFTTPEGTKTSLADFKGRTVLFNLWATWCVPCRLEMPALDRLQSLRGSKDFAVIAVNIDTARLDRPNAFFQENNIKNSGTLYGQHGGGVSSLEAGG